MNKQEINNKTEKFFSENNIIGAHKTPDNNNYNSEIRTAIKLKEKAHIHNITFVKADKGNMTVIISTDNLHNKVQNFMEQNNITELKHDPTDRYQNTVKGLVNKAKHIMTHKQKPYMKQI